MIGNGKNYAPVLDEDELTAIEKSARAVSLSIFSKGLFALGRATIEGFPSVSCIISNNPFAFLPEELLKEIHKFANPDFTAAASFERSVYLVATDGLLMKRYFPVASTSLTG